MPLLHCTHSSVVVVDLSSLAHTTCETVTTLHDNYAAAAVVAVP